jgi:hypothetical protein
MKFYIIGLLLCLVTPLAPFVAADSRTEADLRIRLARSEAQTAAVLKDKADLAASLAKLHSMAVTRSKIASVNAHASSDRVESIAAEAQTTAEINAGVAAVAAKLAVEQSDRIKRDSDRSTITLLITQCFGFVAILAGLIHRAYSDGRNHRWAIEDSRKREAALTGHGEVVLGKLAEVKEEAHAAYTEANDVNLKIASIGLQLSDGSPLKGKH